MPCWTINTVSVEFSAKHVDLILKAAKSIGLSSYYNRESQTIYLDDQIVINLANRTAQVINDNFDMLNKLKRAYSATVIKIVAKKKKWAVQMVGGNGSNKMRIRRY